MRSPAKKAVASVPTKPALGSFPSGHEFPHVKQDCATGIGHYGHFRFHAPYAELSDRQQLPQSFPLRLRCHRDSGVYF
jgi:hypothetical protein